MEINITILIAANQKEQMNCEFFDFKASIDRFLSIYQSLID